jgi:hypothetical protein
MDGDPLDDIVTLTRARCCISTRLEAGGPWAIQYRPPRQIKFMAIVKGGCWLSAVRFKAATGVAPSRYRGLGHTNRTAEQVKSPSHQAIKRLI